LPKLFASQGLKLTETCAVAVWEAEIPSIAKPLPSGAKSTTLLLLLLLTGAESVLLLVAIAHWGQICVITCYCIPLMESLHLLITPTLVIEDVQEI
jgi:hypothetical protein